MPFRFVGTNFRVSFRQSFKIDFGDRQNFAGISQNAYIEFAPVDILFHNRGLLQNVADVFDFLIEMFNIVNDRIMINTDAGIFMLWFYDQWKIDRCLFHFVIGNIKARRFQTGALEQVFAPVFITGQTKSERAWAGVFDTDELKQRGDVRLAQVVAADVFAQIDCHFIALFNECHDDVNGITLIDAKNFVRAFQFTQSANERIETIQNRRVRALLLIVFKQIRVVVKNRNRSTI